MGIVAVKTPLPDRTAKITDVELAKFALDKENFEKLKERYEAAKKLVESRENNLIERIKAGVKIEAKGFKVMIDESFKRRNIQWKEEFIKLLGKAKADEITDNTEPTVYPKLVVEER